MNNKTDDHIDEEDKVEDQIVDGEKECECDDCSCEKEENEYKEKYIRALADYQNLSKRIEREREEIQQSASSWIILKLLPVLDDLELAKDNTEEKGIELIYNKLWNILEKEGIRKMEIKENDAFDPEKMEAIDAESGGEKLKIVRSGYIMKGKILRPAQVKVVK
jgi:molecular chaperone GrpE